MLKQHCQVKPEVWNIHVDKAFYSEYHGCGLQDQTIAIVKSKIKRGLKENKHLKCKDDFALFIAKTLKTEVKGKSVN